MATEWVKKKFTHQFVLVALLVATALIGYTLKPFLDAILGAIILYVLFRPLMRRLVEQKKWKKGMAALFIIFISLILVMIPIMAMSYMTVSYTHLRAHETVLDLVCRLLLEKKTNK